MIKEKQENQKLDSESKPPNKQSHMNDIFSIDFFKKFLNSAQFQKQPETNQGKGRSLEIDERHRSKLENYLSLPLEERTAKIINGIKQDLKEFRCLRMSDEQSEQSQRILSGSLQSEQKFSQNMGSQSISEKNEHKQILKRDLQVLKHTFAMCSTVRYYKRGQLIDVSGTKRDRVRILLKGTVALFEPSNKTSLINCIQRFKRSQTFKSNIDKFNHLAAQISRENQIKSNQTTSNQNTQNLASLNNVNQTISQIGLQFLTNLFNEHEENSREQEFCQQILQVCKIVSPLTPHKKAMLLTQEGQLLTKMSTLSLLSQQIDEQTAFTSVCLSQEAILIQLRFQIFKQILWYVNNDEDKKYINSLMKKFPNLSYFDAKDYINKKQSIIDYLGTKSKLLKNNHRFNDNKLATLLEDEGQTDSQIFQTSLLENLSQESHFQLIKNQQISKQQPRVIKRSSNHVSVNNDYQQLQNQSSSLYFQLPYDKSPYLIIKGQVIIVISKVKLVQHLDQRYSQPRRTFQRHEVLRLYDNDIFGIEEIGQTKDYHLRYQVRKESKILKMDPQILNKHLKNIQSFKEQFQTIKGKRDEILQMLLGNVSQQMQRKVFKQGWQNSKKIVSYKSSPKLNNRGFVMSQSRGTKKSSAQHKQIRKSVNLPVIQLRSEFFTGRPISQRLKNEQKSSSVRNSQRTSSIGYPLRNRQKINSIQFIGRQRLQDVQRQLQQKLKAKEKQSHKSKNSQRLTVQLLKQFKLVDFKEQIKKINAQKQVKLNFIQMRDSKGNLIRRKLVPSFQQISAAKNRQKVQQQIMRKIGLLSQGDTVKHNQKIVTQRKSLIVYQNQVEKQRKQFKRLRKISKSLPKLQNFFSKKANIQYENQRKKKFMI